MGAPALCVSIRLFYTNVYSLTRYPPSSNPLGGGHGWALGASRPFSLRAGLALRAWLAAERSLRLGPTSLPPSAYLRGRELSSGWCSPLPRLAFSSTRARVRPSSASYAEPFPVPSSFRS